MLSLHGLSDTKSFVWADAALIFADLFFTVPREMASWTSLVLINWSTGTTYLLQQMFLLWRPLLPFLSLLTPNIPLPASSLLKTEITVLCFWLEAVCFPCSGEKSCYTSVRQWMHFSCLLGRMRARNWGNHLQMRQLCESQEERNVQHFSGGFSQL